MVKKLVKIVSILILLALIVAGVFFYSIYISVDRVNISYETISSKKIPKDMNDLKIAFVSDIKYNEFMDKKRLTSMIDKLNKTGADVVIFGGDIFSDPDVNAPDSQMTLDLTEILKGIDAPLGKFAILGDEDEVNGKTKKLVKSILYNSDFEILTNSSVRIRNKSSSSITLVGIDSLVNGDPDPAKAMKKISKDEFNILITHCPDLLTSSDLNMDNLDLMIAGHSLGGQVYLPLLGPLHSQKGALTYNHGSYNINNAVLYVSNGLGTKGMDMRFMAPPQILMFRLHHSS